MRRMAGLLFAGGLAAGLGAVTAIAHASDRRPAQAWHEIFLPFDNGQGNTMCVDVADGGGTAAGTGCGFPGPVREERRAARWQFGAVLRVSNTTAACASASLTADLRCRPGARCAWQQVRQSRDGTDPYFRLETSGPGGPALCMAAGNLGGTDQTPLVTASCQGFGNAAEILELG